MIVLTSLEDLKKYLEARKIMAEQQRVAADNLVSPTYGTLGYVNGMVFAFDEALKAVESMLRG